MTLFPDTSQKAQPEQYDVVAWLLSLFCMPVLAEAPVPLYSQQLFLRLSGIQQKMYGEKIENKAARQAQNHLGLIASRRVQAGQQKELPH
ncbi:MAG: hypothetical protein D3918_15610 [Candidatus Electrothrix sp. AX2]|nr:hypothetical protein [Candidatus Electrothrix gigas]